ncbi:MAG: NYN domain-containing protein [Spirochaetaceae bacterium]|nr:NYN domain-containing protein [Spirochaetaceae bacterium]
MEQLTRIQFVADGSYGRKIYSYLSEGIDLITYSIHWDKLLEYVSSTIEKIDNRRSIFTKKVFFIGSNPEYDEANMDYYRSLESAGIQRISFPLRSTQNKDGKSAYKEDAVDTSLVFSVAKDFYTSKIEDRFDWLVLLAGDGDLVPLVQGLATEGVRTLVIYFDFSTPFGTTRASQGLLESAHKVISLENLFRERVDPDAKAVFSQKEKLNSINNETFQRVKNAIIEASAYDYLNSLTSSDIERAIELNTRKDPEGWVLVAQIGKQLEMQLGAKLPYGVKLRTEIEKYPEKFETKEVPAYSVRLKQVQLKKRITAKKK